MHKATIKPTKEDEAAAIQLQIQLQQKQLIEAEAEAKRLEQQKFINEVSHRMIDPAMSK
jgi:hypothetical protein